MIPHIFSCDMVVLGCQGVEMKENCEGFAASAKMKFLLSGKMIY